MDRNLIIRIGTLTFTLLNLILTAFGCNPLPVSETLAYSIISIVATIAATIWNAWKNNNITSAAKIAQNVLDAIKEGKLTAEAVQEWLNTILNPNKETDNKSVEVITE